MATKEKIRKRSVVRGKAKTPKKKSKRTVLYSRSGKKLYAKRSKRGTFTDIQSYQRSHSADLKRTSKAERVGRAKKKSKKPAPLGRAGKKVKAASEVVAPTVVKKAKKAAQNKAQKAHSVPAAKASAKRAPSPRIVRAAMTVKQIPRAERSYAVKPKPGTDPVIELAVPELAVTTSGQGEVPAGGE